MNNAVMARLLEETADLLESYLAQSGLAKGGQPLADLAGIPLRRLTRPRIRPTATQQPQGMPPLPTA